MRPEDDDILSLLLGTPQPGGGGAPTKWLRDNFCGMYGAATETTSVALTWLWPTLAANPDVFAKLIDEVERVVGAGPVVPEQLPKLVYTRQVVNEMLRHSPVAWMITRSAVAEDVIDGVRIDKGADVIISQYLTHRSSLFWDRPEVFDPERFAPGAPEPHRYAYFPFGGGEHLCIGSHMFLAEAQIVIASLLSRFRPEEITPSKVTPQLAASLRPREAVTMTLRPIE